MTENLNEESEMWAEHKKNMQNMRIKRRNQFNQVVKNWLNMGFIVREISEFQFRFNDVLDIYPSNKRYHDFKTNTRGDIRGQSFDQFLRKYFNLKQK